MGSIEFGRIFIHLWAILALTDSFREVWTRTPVNTPIDSVYNTISSSNYLKSFLCRDDTNISNQESASDPLQRKARLRASIIMHIDVLQCKYVVANFDAVFLRYLPWFITVPIHILWTTQSKHEEKVDDDPISLSRSLRGLFCTGLELHWRKKTYSMYTLQQHYTDMQSRFMPSNIWLQGEGANV